MCILTAVSCNKNVNTDLNKEALTLQHEQALQFCSFKSIWFAIQFPFRNFTEENMPNDYSFDSFHITQMAVRQPLTCSGKNFLYCRSWCMCFRMCRKANIIWAQQHMQPVWKLVPSLLSTSTGSTSSWVGISLLERAGKAVVLTMP